MLVAGLSAWTWPPPAAPPAAEVLGLLPRGSLLARLVRLEATGVPPLETAVVAAVPQFPGAAGSVYYGFVLAYDRWRRHVTRVYAEPLPGPIPVSPDAGQIDRRREAAIFSALHADGSRVDRVVGVVRGRWGSLDAATSSRILAGRPHSPAGVTWRFRARAGVLTAQSRVLRVRVRQPVRIVPSGGGPAPIIIPDSRLDVIEQGYRAREPGTYTVRVLLPFAPDQGFTLMLVVE